MAKRTTRERNPQSVFYRVSVLDETTNKWFVKHAGKTKSEAEAVVAGYYDSGIMARISACL